MANANHTVDRPLPHSTMRRGRILSVSEINSAIVSAEAARPAHRRQDAVDFVGVEEVEHRVLLMELHREATVEYGRRQSGRDECDACRVG